MAQAVQVKCRGCGQFIQRRADVFDPQHDDYAANEREYRQEWLEHDCQAEYTGYSMAPRPGEYDAWLATLSDAELVEELGEAGAAAYLAGPGELEPAAAAELAAPVAEAEPTVEAEMVGLAEVLRAAAETPSAKVEPPAVVRPPLVEVSAEDWARAMAAEVITAAEEITRTAPAPWIADRATMAPLFTEGSYERRSSLRDLQRAGRAQRGRRVALPGTPARRTIPAPWPSGDHGTARLDGRRHASGHDAGAGAARAAAAGGADAPGRQRPPRDQGTAVGRSRAAADAGRRLTGRPRRRRGPWRLSRLLRWLQEDDPRLAGRLERAARAAEAVERQFVA